MNICRDISVSSLTRKTQMNTHLKKPWHPKAPTNILEHLCETNTMEHALLTGKDCNLCTGKGIS